MCFPNSEMIETQISGTSVDVFVLKLFLFVNSQRIATPMFREIS